MKRAALVLGIVSGIAAPVFAANLAPSTQEIAVAAATGKAQVKADGGYPLRDHLLYAVKDARGIDPADGEVDAIIVATPLERTRHAAYIAERTGRSLSPQAAYTSTELPTGYVSILVFAHGKDAEDDSFPKRFGQASLIFPDGIIDAVDTDRGEPSEAVYPLATVNRQRNVATITYRFNLSQWPDAGRRSGRLVFIDGDGKRFDLPLDLSRFE